MKEGVALEEVRLPDLEVIRRFSIAVRREHAPAEEVLEALRADLQKLTGSTRRETRASEPDGAAPTARAKPSRTPAPAASRAPAKKATRKPARKSSRR